MYAHPHFSDRFRHLADCSNFDFVGIQVSFSCWSLSSQGFFFTHSRSLGNSTKGHPLSAVGLTITWVFLQMSSASLIAIMHSLYPVEVLALPLRAKVITRPGKALTISCANIPGCLK
jgi:hypothetical protein